MSDQSYDPIAALALIERDAQLLREAGDVKAAERIERDAARLRKKIAEHLGKPDGREGE